MEPMSELSFIVTFLRRQGDLRHGGGATDSDIRELEGLWGKNLPEDYREFLKTFGWVTYGSTEIPGLGKELAGNSHLDVSNLARFLWAPPSRLSKDLFPFYNSGGDWYYCFRQLDVKVVVWDPMYGEDQLYDETYESWTHWFRATLIDSLED